MTVLETLANTTDVLRCLHDPDWCLVDCRFDLMSPSAGYENYLKGHIPGAVYANLDNDLSGPVQADTGRHPLPDIAELAVTFGRLGITSSTKVVIYDAGSGAIAARAWWLLRWLGHEHVALLDGGFDRWHREGLPIESGLVVKEPSVLNVPLTTRTDAIISTNEVIESLQSGNDLRLVDARDAARFKGVVEPLDPIAGHIPGTLNLPFTQCLNDDETWRPAAALRRILAGPLDNDPEAPWGVMCGSGVTACHLVVSARLAGYRQPRLYAGSWSEWIRDPRRPVETD